MEFLNNLEAVFVKSGSVLKYLPHGGAMLTENEKSLK